MSDIRGKRRGVTTAVVTRDNARWQVSITPSGAGAAGVTQAHAIEVARRMVADVGGGTVLVHDRRGRVREALNVAVAPTIERLA